MRVRLVQSTLEEHIPLDSLGGGGLPHAPPPTTRVCASCAPCARPRPPGQSQAHPQTTAVRHTPRQQLAPHHRGRNLRGRRPSAHHCGRIRAAGSTPAARTPTDPRAHRVPYRARSRSLPLARPLHNARNPPRQETFCATRTLCRDRQASRCRDRQAVATPLSQAAAVASRRCPLSRWSS